MSSIKEILASVSHRPWILPEGKFAYYQEWNKVVFMHFKVSIDDLRTLVPDELEIDLFQSEAYVSIVAFTMEKIRPRLLPSVSFVSDFHEINVRTYVKKNGISGVYFLSIESEKWFSSLVAKTLSGLPYKTIDIKREENEYNSVNKRENFHLHLKYTVSNCITKKTELDKWLTERYALFLEETEELFLDEVSKLYSYQIHHKEWELNKIDFTKLDYEYLLGKVDLRQLTPVCTHYSKGIQVLAWSRKRV